MENQERMEFIASLKRSLGLQLGDPKMLHLRREFGDRPFTLLDVGAGNHSATFLKRIFPQCEYYGLDISRSYDNDENDFALMEEFYELDLTLLQFDKIPDNFFDAILMTHVIEHLHNGDKVLEGLLPKLKRGGVIYVEYPGVRSTRLPSMRASLNFYDDPTHVRLYHLNEIVGALTNGGLRIVKSGTRRNWLFILIMPLLLPYRYLKRGYFVGGDFWDLTGFAESVYGRKE